MSERTNDFHFVKKSIYLNSMWHMTRETEITESMLPHPDNPPPRVRTLCGRRFTFDDLRQHRDPHHRPLSLCQRCARIAEKG